MQKRDGHIRFTTVVLVAVAAAEPGQAATQCAESRAAPGQTVRRRGARLVALSAVLRIEAHVDFAIELIAIAVFEAIAAHADHTLPVGIADGHGVLQRTRGASV